jgi:hypothetical protein
MSPLPPLTLGHADLDGMSLTTLQPVVEQVDQAIQSGQFAAAYILIEAVSTAGEESDSQV